MQSRLFLNSMIVMASLLLTACAATGRAIARAEARAVARATTYQPRQVATRELTERALPATHPSEIRPQSQSESTASRITNKVFDVAVEKGVDVALQSNRDAETAEGLLFCYKKGSESGLAIGKQYDLQDLTDVEIDSLVNLARNDVQHLESGLSPRQLECYVAGLKDGLKEARSPSIAASTGYLQAWQPEQVLPADDREWTQAAGFETQSGQRCEPVADLSRYYQLISSDQFEEAYELRCQASRTGSDSTSLGYFRRAWESNDWVRMEDPVVESRSGDQARVKGIQIWQDTQEGRTTVTRCVVCITMKLEAGAWRYVRRDTLGDPEPSET